MDDALRSFDGVLAEKPTNVVALLGKVCLFISNGLWVCQLTIFIGSYPLRTQKLQGITSVIPGRPTI